MDQPCGHGLSMGQGLGLQVVDSMGEPVQPAPPFCGGGLEHLLCLILVAPPQDTGHGDHGSQGDHPPSTGQGSVLHEVVSIGEPVQPAPPCCGGGLEHLLCLRIEAPPHDTGHGGHGSQGDHPPSMGQGSVLQAVVSKGEPVQSAPPFCGGGLEHLLCLVIEAPPQDTGHGDHGSQGDHPPSTGQGSVLHEVVSKGEPVQLAPPFCGGGLEHALCLVIEAPPHDTGHGGHGSQGDHPPSMGQ